MRAQPIRRGKHPNDKSNKQRNRKPHQALIIQRRFGFFKLSLFLHEKYQPLTSIFCAICFVVQRVLLRRNTQDSCIMAHIRHTKTLLLCTTLPSYGDSLRKTPREIRGAFRDEIGSGSDLLSQGVTPQVPSALEGLTSVFGMGTGVAPPLLPPER